MPTLTEKLIEILAREPDQQTLDRARRHLLDWCACAAGALPCESAQIMQRFAAQQAPGAASVIGADSREPLIAAFTNGALGNVLEMDDVHRSSVLHPGPIVIPAALAFAQSRGATYRELLIAIVRGYEATIRVGRALGPSHYRFFHTTSSAGAFGAAAAVASLLGLNAAQCADALGNAGTRTGGLWQLRLEDVMSKSLHNAAAARSGCEAAVLAEMGFSGPREILEGPLGLFNATAPDADASQVACEESDWLIHACSFKPWPACRHAHPAIDAALALRQQLEKLKLNNPLADPGPIVKVRVETYADALKFCDRVHPSSEAQAKFSIQHAVALTLLHGAPKLEHYREPYLSSPYVRVLRERIVVSEGPDFTRNYPQHFAAKVTLEQQHGMHLTHTVHDALGDPENPLDERALKLKALHLLAHAAVPERARHELIWACLESPALEDLTIALGKVKSQP